MPKLLLCSVSKSAFNLNKMDRETYKMMAELMHKVPPQKETPEGQKFHIGEIVRISKPNSWFAKDSFEKSEYRLYQIEYSYKQKYGGGMEHHTKTYSLKHLFEDNSSAWYDEEELELVKSIEEINNENDVLEYERLKLKFGDKVE